MSEADRQRDSIAEVYKEKMYTAMEGVDDCRYLASQIIDLANQIVDAGKNIDYVFSIFGSSVKDEGVSYVSENLDAADGDLKDLDRLNKCLQEQLSRFPKLVNEFRKGIKEAVEAQEKFESMKADQT